MRTIGLIAIMKNEEDNIGRMLSSVAKWIDKIVIVDTGSTDKSVEIAKNFGVQVIEVGDRFVHPLYEGGIPIFNFDEAKNFALDNLDTDYLLWLDSDDELQGGENLRKLISVMEEQNIDAMFCRYLYYCDFDDKGQIRNINIEHLRERIIKNDKSHKWVGKLHETLIQQRQVRQSDTQDILVIHHTAVEEMEKAMWRNIIHLQEIVLKEDGKDPRNVYYLAKTLYDTHDEMFHEYFIALIKQYLETSGWAEERAQAWTYLAQIHYERGEFDLGIQAALMSLQENPKFPDSYIILALCYIGKKDWQLALHWARIASQVDLPKTTLIVSPRDIQTRILEVIFHACLNLAKLDEAVGANDRLLEIFPDNELFVGRKQQLEELKWNNVLAHSIVKLAHHHKQKGDMPRLLSTIAAMPQEIANEPAMVDLMQDVYPARVWESKEIAIYCGPHFEGWSPKSLAQGGIGGSEEAVILLSQELAKLGWRVTIFADPKDAEGEYDGVMYKPYYYFNGQDEFNIFISWRQPTLFDIPIKAKKNLIWCHDVQNDADYTPARLQRIDKVIFLSQAHRETAPSIPEDKIFISSNGVTLPKFNWNAKKRDSHKMFYGSSYDRGLEHLLNMWPKIRQQVPEATLEICYGWNTFEVMFRDNPERMAWKEKMDKLMAQPGITHHGRLNQIKLCEVMLGCAIWAYPTHFYEISCITAMRAQMLGLIPMVVNYAALKETVKFGRKIDGDIYDQETKDLYLRSLVNLLTGKGVQISSEAYRTSMMMEAQAKFGWDQVAKKWTNILFKPEMSLEEAMKILNKYDPKLEEFKPIIM